MLGESRSYCFQASLLVLARISVNIWLPYAVPMASSVFSLGIQPTLLSAMCPGK